MSVFAIAAIDVALSAVNDSATADSVQQTRRRLTEATLGLEIGLPPTTRLVDGKYVRFRRFFAGPFAKVFSTVPYYGVNIGAVELEGSSFRSSYLLLGFMRRFYPDSDAQRENLYVEFFLRSGNVDFFKLLSIRGGILFPIGARAQEEGTISRIAIEVPVVSWPF
jgi:hypothetical protein